MAKSFADIFKRYKTYDDSQGRGSVTEWRAAWDRKMGKEEAEAVLSSDNPLAVLGLTTLPASLDELKRVYRKLIMKHQESFRQDASTDEQEKARKIIAAYSLLEDRFGVSNSRRARTP